MESWQKLHAVHPPHKSFKWSFLSWPQTQASFQRRAAVSTQILGMFFYSKIYLLFLWVCVCLCITCMQGHCSSEEEIRFSGTGSYGLPYAAWEDQHVSLTSELLQPLGISQGKRHLNYTMNETQGLFVTESQTQLSQPLTLWLRKNYL